MLFGKVKYLRCYHYLLAQVQCERSFSKLKIIKTRLRNALSEEHLDAYMLMAVENDLLEELSLDSIIDRVAQSSMELSRLLSIT